MVSVRNCVFVAVVLLVSSCGGGGGGGGIGTVDVRSAYNMASAISSEVHRIAAQNQPKQGSVTQSSNGSGVTTDTIGITHTGGTPSFTELNISVTRTPSSGTPVTIDSRPPAFVDEERVSDTEWSAQHIMSRQTGDSRVWYREDASSDFMDGDWLAGGIWLEVTETGGSGPPDIEVAVFADGGNEPPEAEVRPQIRDWILR